MGQGKKGKGIAEARNSRVAMANGGTANDLDAMHQLLHIKLKVRVYNEFPVREASAQLHGVDEDHADITQCYALTFLLKFNFLHALTVEAYGA